MFTSVVLSADQSPLQLAEAFAELARVLAAQGTVEETLEAITRHAVAVGCSANFGHVIGGVSYAAERDPRLLM